MVGFGGSSVLDQAAKNSTGSIHGDVGSSN